MNSVNNILTEEFYNQKTTIVAQQLLGKILVRQLNDQTLSGIIIETEAYLPFDDPASHNYKGKTTRNNVLYGKAGKAYVHSIHKYHCLDLVTEEENYPGSVLIRALKPLKGMEIMKINRNTQNINNLTSGPGKLCQALQVTRELNSVDVTTMQSPIFVLDNKVNEQVVINATSRIGITKAVDLPLRFYIKI